MNTWLLYAAAAASGYIIGNVEFAVILSRLLHRDDVRRHGSGNAGSTNMMRVYGLRDGVLTFCGDFLKGAAGVFLGGAIAGRYGSYICALCVVLGHCFPVFFGFKGGKGVASAFGAIVALNPLWGGVVALAAAITILATHTISAASIVGAATYFAAALIFSEDIWEKLFAAAAFAVLTARHRDNISRLIRGSESKAIDEAVKKAGKAAEDDGGEK